MTGCIGCISVNLPAGGIHNIDSSWPITPGEIYRINQNHSPHTFLISLSFYLSLSLIPYRINQNHSPHSHLSYLSLSISQSLYFYTGSIRIILLTPFSPLSFVLSISLILYRINQNHSPHIFFTSLFFSILSIALS